jgi:hypothetical protein
VEWVQTVGAAAGIAPGAARISTGALGAPESRLEVHSRLDACINVGPSLHGRWGVAWLGPAHRAGPSQLLSSGSPHACCRARWRRAPASFLITRSKHMPYPRAAIVANGSQLEVTFDSMGDWEAFLARVPAAQHRAWSQRVQGMVVDGSTRWEVFRTVDIPAEPGGGGGGAAAAAVPASAAPAPAARAPAARGGGSDGSGGNGGGGKLVFADKVGGRMVVYGAWRYAYLRSYTCSAGCWVLRKHPHAAESRGPSSRD